MNPNEQELLKKLIETFAAWNKDLQLARDEYKDSIQLLDAARARLEMQEKSAWQRGLAYAPWIVLSLVVLLMASLILVFQCGTFTYQNFTYTRPC